MLPASIVPKSGQVLWSHHCRVSSMTYLLHLHMMIRQMVSRGLVYPQRVSRLTYTAPHRGAKIPFTAYVYSTGLSVPRERYMGSTEQRYAEFHSLFKSPIYQ